MRAVPCALAAQTRGGVDSRDERRTLASEVLRMSRALHEVLRMSCAHLLYNRVNATVQTTALPAEKAAQFRYIFQQNAEGLS